MSTRYRNILIAVITFVWAVNFTAPVIEHTYKPPAEINVAFMGVVGLLAATKTNGNGNGTDSKTKTKSTKAKD